MRTYAPFHHAPVGGPWSHGPKAAFRAAPETLASLGDQVVAVEGPEGAPLFDLAGATVPDGVVAGVWRPVEGGIEATAFHPLPDEAWMALAEEAAALAGFLAGRDPASYRRYGHWWAKLPAGAVRVLPG